jgi:thiol-disulfide isomerase/thioredoxin
MFFICIFFSTKGQIPKNNLIKISLTRHIGTGKLGSLVKLVKKTPENQLLDKIFPSIIGKQFCYNILFEGTPILVGVWLDKNHKTIIIDANNNGNLSDENIYTFEKQQEKWIGKPAIEIITNPLNPKHFRTITLLNSGDNSSYKQIEDNAFVVKHCDYWEGKAEVNKNTIQFYVRPWSSGDYWSDSDFEAVAAVAPVKDLDNKNTIHFVAHKNDCFRYLDTIYRYKFVSENIDTLYIEVTSDKFIKGEVGDNLTYNKKSIKEKEVVIPNHKNYVLLDFWGTWCGPCVENLDKIEEIYEVYHPKGLEVIGIVTDKSSSTVTDFLDKRPLGWEQVYDKDFTSKMKNSLSQDCKIIAYPTLMLLSPDGEIIYKSVSANPADDIKQIKLKLKSIYGK